MKKVNLSGFISSLTTAFKRHSPEILTGVGIAGMITTVIVSVRSTPKAIRLLEEKKAESEEKLKAVDVVKTTWKCYIPSAIVGTVSVACLIGASSANLRRNAALATAYTLSETAMRDYKAKVIETIGEKKEQAVRDSIAKDKIEKDPVEKHEVIITNVGDTLCYDTLSGRYFKSDIESIRKIINVLNRRMRSEMYISLNDFYYEIGLDEIGIGNDLGWEIDKGYIEIDFSANLTSNGQPCIVLNYSVEPQYNYRPF